MQDKKDEPFVFPKWLDSLRPVIGLVLGCLPIYALLLLYYGGAPQATDVGYAPEQPVPYSHALHAGEMGIDCRYCHTSVESGPKANIPPTATCMNCHTAIYPDNPKLIPIRESFATGMPVRWVRVHDLPDYVYFDHSAHVTRGVGCVECHGRVDKMEVVYQAEPLSMGWCLDCHRNPDSHLRPPELVTDLAWQPHPDEADSLARRLREELNINPSEDCSTCHR